MTKLALTGMLITVCVASASAMFWLPDPMQPIHVPRTINGTPQPKRKATTREFPLIDFSSQQWKCSEGAKIENGELTITGTHTKYCKATLLIPVDQLGGNKFYVVGMAKAQNVERGEHAYSWPKFIMYYENDPTTRRASYLSLNNTGDTWITHSLLYQPQKGHPAKNIVLEIRMAFCSGVTRFKNLRITDVMPSPEQSFPYPIPENVHCRLAINTTETHPFNRYLLGLNSHFMGYSKHLTYGDERIQQTIRKIKAPLLRFPGGTVANWYDYETDMWTIAPNCKTSSVLFNRLKAGIADGRHFGFDKYLEMAKQDNFATTLVLNILHDSPARCVERVLARKKQGLVFPWVELGNENYADSQQSTDINNADAYITKARVVTDLLHKTVLGLIVLPPYSLSLVTLQ